MTIYVQFSDCGQHIRKWSREPFEGGAEFSERPTAPDVERMREALEAARNILANSGAESGYCMCGDPVEGHTIGSGHAPVDSHLYVADRIVEQIDAALQSTKAEGEASHG